MLKEVTQIKPDEFWIYGSFSQRENKNYPQTAIPRAMLEEHEPQIMCNFFCTLEQLRNGGLYLEQVVAILKDRRENPKTDSADLFKELSDTVEAWEKKHKSPVAV